MQDVKIDKLKLKVGDKTLEVTEAQAKALRDLLNEMWPAEKPWPYVPYQPSPIPANPLPPVYPEVPTFPMPQLPPWWEKPLVTWEQQPGSTCQNVCVVTLPTVEGVQG